MLTFDASVFYALMSYLQSMKGRVGAAQHERNKKIDEATREELMVALDSMLPHLETLYADISHLYIYERLSAGSFVDNATWGEFADAVQYLDTTIRLELSAKHLLVLEPHDVRYFAPERPLFGSEFDQKFISAGSSELNDAAKCLALGRSTAAVFHLMRIMELGIRALAACLGIPDPIKPAERNWAVMLRKIRDDGIHRKWPTAADRMSGDGATFDSLYASLDAVKSPWRAHYAC
jgi:hypothetical protein